MRHGTTSLFAAFNIADGTGISQLHRQQRAVEYRQFPNTIDKAVPAELGVHLICDNYGTRKTADEILESLSRYCLRISGAGH